MNLERHGYRCRPTREHGDSAHVFEVTAPNSGSRAALSLLKNQNGYWDLYFEVEAINLDPFRPNLSNREYGIIAAAKHIAHVEGFSRANRYSIHDIVDDAEPIAQAAQLLFSLYALIHAPFPRTKMTEDSLGNNFIFS